MNFTDQHFLLSLLEDPKFFVAMATLIFAALTFKPIKNGLVSMLDSRIEKVKKDLSEAERLKHEAETLLNTAKGKLNDSEKQAKEIIAFAKKESELLMQNTKNKLEKDVEIRKKLALQKIQSFEETSINDLKKNISNITIAVAAQIIEESGNENDFEKLVGVSLEKLSKTVH